MSDRIQVLVDANEKVRFQRAAEHAQKSLSAWLRDIAVAHLEELETAPRFRDVPSLTKFFENRAEKGDSVEPDWEEQKALIAQSVATGRSRE